MFKFITYFYAIFLLIVKVINYFFIFIYVLFINFLSLLITLNFYFYNLVDVVLNYFNIPLYVIHKILIKFSFLNYSLIGNLLYDTNLILNYIIFIFQVLFIVIITIWTRAAGPRFRLDQLLSLTWKDLFIYLSLFLVFILVIVVLV